MLQVFQRWKGEGLGKWRSCFVIFFSPISSSAVFLLSYFQTLSLFCLSKILTGAFRVNSQEETKSYLSVLDVFHLFLREWKKVNNSRTIKKGVNNKMLVATLIFSQRFPGQAASWGLAWGLTFRIFCRQLFFPWRRDRLPTPMFLGSPRCSVGKESTCNVGDLG